MCLRFPCFWGLQAILVGGYWRALCRHQGCSLIAGLLLAVRVVHECDHRRFPREHSGGAQPSTTQSWGGQAEQKKRGTVNTAVQATGSLKRRHNFSREATARYVTPSPSNSWFSLLSPQAWQSIQLKVTVTFAVRENSKMQHWNNLILFLCHSFHSRHLYFPCPITTLWQRRFLSA